MKSCLLIILALTAVMSASAQQAYKASEGLGYATTEAKKTLGDDIELVAIATANGLSAGTFTVSYDPSTGEGSAWLYAFINGDGETTNVIAASLPFVGFLDVTSVVGDLSAFNEFLPSTALSTSTWIDSDIAGSVLLNSTDYKQLAQQYPQAELKFIALGNNEINSAIPFGEPYWVITFEDENDETYYICDIQADNSNIVCFDVYNSSIEEERTGVTVVANNSVISIVLEKSLSTRFYIYDVMGRVVTMGETSNSIVLNQADIPTGKLFVSIENDLGSYNTSLTNVK